MKNKDYLAIGASLGAAFFWSFSFVWFKIAFLAYDPLTVVIIRLAIAALLITTIAALFKSLQKPTGKDLRLFILMAFFEPFIYFLGESYGLKYVSPTVAAVIVATIPLFTPLAAWYFHKERVKKVKRHHKKVWTISMLILVLCHISILVMAYMHVTPH